MKLNLELRNESRFKHLYRRDVLRELAARVCRGEGLRDRAVEVSVLLCDDAFIAELNLQYRKKAQPTDVLSFGQDAMRFHGARVLGDIVISLETVADRCVGDRGAMRAEVKLLFCHGLLHLLGAEHGNAKERKAMTEKQARYLGIEPEAAWDCR